MAWLNRNGALDASLLPSTRSRSSTMAGSSRPIASPCENSSMLKNSWMLSTSIVAFWLQGQRAAGRGEQIFYKINIRDISHISIEVSSFPFNASNRARTTTVYAFAASFSPPSASNNTRSSP